MSVPLLAESCARLCQVAQYPKDTFLVRHGETKWNVAGRRQGQLDSPLTEKGHGDTEKLIRALRPTGIDAVFTSPLGRTVATATPIADGLNLPIHMIQDLAEINHGSYAGLTNTQIEALHPGELARRNETKYEWQFPGGESYRTSEKRATKALEQIARTDTRRPLIVAHEMIGRMLAKCLTTMTVKEALDWRLPHGVVVRFTAGNQNIEDP